MYLRFTTIKHLSNLSSNKSLSCTRRPKQQKSFHMWYTQPAEKKPWRNTSIQVIHINGIILCINRKQILRSFTRLLHSKFIILRKEDCTAEPSMTCNNSLADHMRWKDTRSKCSSHNISKLGIQATNPQLLEVEILCLEQICRLPTPLIFYLHIAECKETKSLER
jgi:hypothetical protein